MAGARVIVEVIHIGETKSQHENKKDRCDALMTQKIRLKIAVL